MITMIDNGDFESRLEVPDGRDPEQNAWLTLTMRYSLNFADSRNRVPGVIVQQGGKVVARDADRNEFPIVDWDFNTVTKFNRAFRRGEGIWNWQFVLVTPQHYDELDYESLAGSGWIVRPNVLCLFRLEPNAAKAHLRITVVRLDPSITDARTFRSNKTLYDHLDVWAPTLGHELGHALGMGHVKELVGDAQCIADAKRGVYPDRCYGETPFEKANIMGGGAAINAFNAKPWLDRIADHSQLPRSDWTVASGMATPPRKIPLGVGLVGKPKVF